MIDKMFKKSLIALVLLVALSYLVIAAQDRSDSCGIFCQAGKYWSGLFEKGVVVADE